jgi:hypothetical protein
MVWVVLAVFALILVGAMLMLVRNHLVFQARSEVLDEVSRLSQLDIDADREWEWRYEAFDRHASYDEMMLKFWRRPSGFYEGAPFLK